MCNFVWCHIVSEKNIYSEGTYALFFCVSNEYYKFNIYLQMTTNSFTICGEEMQSIGVGIYLGLVEMSSTKNFVLICSVIWLIQDGNCISIMFYTHKNSEA